MLIRHFLAYWWLNRSGKNVKKLLRIEVNTVQPSLLRRFWDMVNHLNPHQVLPMDDERLQMWLLDRLQESAGLDGNQFNALHRYIHDRIPLIRQIVAGV